MMHEVVYATHPFDVGWDGYNYPYGFSIHNFEPIQDGVHQPPPVHQTFETSTFVVCFVQDCTITIQNQFHLTITVILIVMRFVLCRW
jgi:homogentisate 1,2-dioxygenase